MKKKMNHEKVKKVAYGAVRFLASAAVMLVSIKMNACASSSIGDNALKLVTDNVSAIAWAVLACVMLTILSKRNWVGAVVTGVVGAAVCIVIGNPTILQKVGETIVNSIFGY